MMSQATSEGIVGCASAKARRGRLARATRAILVATQAQVANGAWKADPCLAENDYYRLRNQPRG
jgi:hypothetical protein